MWGIGGVMAGLYGTGERPCEPCPGCGRDDGLKSVPAVHRAAQRALFLPWTDGRSGLYRALAWAPPPRKPTMPQALLVNLIVVVGVILFVVGLAQKRRDDERAGEAELPGSTDPAPEPGPEFPALWWISLAIAVLYLVFFAWATQQMVSHQKLLAGRANARLMWACAWHCAHCAGVHFPQEQPARALTLQEFRTRVWTAGGYGQLVGRYPPAV
ncbi:hypothetical protein ACIBCM_34660 [Streptomyces sp. NPDC051018]|uniref:hypothetical protein n=1 Tax=Streptomyces sp. NPDC051018 TaxID=3365639 RepID=UPI003793B0A7